MSSTPAFPPDIFEFMCLVIKTKYDLLVSNADFGSFSCPRCGKHATVQLVGRKSHARAVCLTDGCLSMME